MDDFARLERAATSLEDLQRALRTAAAAVGAEVVDLSAWTGPAGGLWHRQVTAALHGLEGQADHLASVTVVLRDRAEEAARRHTVGA